MWATSTTRDRQSLWARFQNYLLDHSLPMTDMTAAWFVESCDARPSSRLTYAKTLLALFNKLDIPSGLLRMQCGGLRGMGALIPDTQATGITKEDVLELANSLPRREGAFVLLMWKTASRWDEMSKITTDNIILRTPEKIVVSWLNRTKTSRGDPFKATLFTVVTGDWTDRIHRDLTATPGAALTQMRYNDLLLALASTFPTKAYSAHSFKHGAISRAAMAVKEHDLDPRALALLGKHAIVSDITEMTIRYNNKDRDATLAIADILGTGELTRHL